jgi:hypothetical protein
MELIWSKYFAYTATTYNTYKQHIASFLSPSTAQKIGPAGMGMGSRRIRMYTYRMSIYGHTQLPCQQSWLQTVLKFQISQFMKHKLNKNQIHAKFHLPVHEPYKKQPYNWLSHHVNGMVTGPVILYHFNPVFSHA